MYRQAPLHGVCEELDQWWAVLNHRLVMVRSHRSRFLALLGMCNKFQGVPIFASARAFVFWFCSSSGYRQAMDRSIYELGARVVVKKWNKNVFKFSRDMDRLQHIRYTDYKLIWISFTDIHYIVGNSNAAICITTRYFTECQGATSKRSWSGGYRLKFIRI